LANNNLLLREAAYKRAFHVRIAFLAMQFSTTKFGMDALERS